MATKFATSKKIVWVVLAACAVAGTWTLWQSGPPSLAAPRSAAAAPEVPAAWETYSSDMLGLSLSYPPQLHLNSNDSISGTGFGSLRLARSDEVDGELTLSIEAKYNISESEFIQQLVRDGKRLSHTTERSTIGGYPATRHILAVEYDEDPRPDVVDNRVGIWDIYWLPRGGSRGYVIRKYTSTDHTETILSTLRLLDLARAPEDVPLAITSYGAKEGTREDPWTASVGWISSQTISLNKKHAAMHIDWGDGTLETRKYNALEEESHWLNHGYETVGDYVVTLTVTADGETLKKSLFLKAR